MSEIYITLITYFTILLILTWGYRKSLAWGKSLPGKAGGGGGGGVGENYSLTLNAKGLTFNKKESSPSFSPLSLTSF